MVSHQIKRCQEGKCFRSIRGATEDFAGSFQDENGVAEMKKIIWLSGKKRYGSMAIYLSRQADADALLSRRIAHVRGEAAFPDKFYAAATTAMPQMSTVQS